MLRIYNNTNKYNKLGWFMHQAVVTLLSETGEIRCWKRVK